ncbi:MAG TPA: OsmC family protein [Candidatus Krumholzibacterium sp.]|nr:OsmC family protein [Candidatus Krumholzibacterium sp.]
MEITVSLPGMKATSTEYKGFTIRTGQPVSSGGDGSAPSPFDLFLVSLASCAGAYVTFFCESRDIPTDDIQVVQKMEVDPEKHMIGRISIEVRIPDDFPEKYVKPLLKSVDQCTVKKHILDPPEFEVTARRS